MADVYTREQELRDAIWPPGSRIPTRIVHCRHCGRRNRVSVATAALEPERHSCGTCGDHLFVDRDEPLTDLASEAYQHGLDKRSLALLRSTPGVPKLVKWMYENLGDRSAQLLFMSETIQCSAEQFPELLELVDKACRRMDLRVHPRVYLGESPYMNALTTGVKEPVIVVRSALLDQMNDDELLAVIGHELGHLHAAHALYHSVATALVLGGSVVSGSLRLLGSPIRHLLLRWLRHSELTADRAALLTSRDLSACIGVMLTFAGGNRPGTSRRTQMRLGPFLRQCRELARLEVGFGLDGVLSGYLALGRTHPYVATRVNHLVQWVEHGNYLNILAGEYARRDEHGEERADSEARANDG